MRATNGQGDLEPLQDCYIETPDKTIYMKILPEISDSKSASYNDEPIIGRSFPLKTYSHSENRDISWTAHFMVLTEADLEDNMESLRAIESLVYPEDVNTGGAPYAPPPICRIKCGALLAHASQGGDVCAVLYSYSVKFPTDVVWDDNEYIPHKFDVDMQWKVVYDSQELPGRDRIFRTDGPGI
jgi:hypothetical protein